MSRKRILAWAVAGAWAGVIFALSSVPGSSLPGRFGALAHFLEYALLAVLLMAALSFGRSWSGAALLAIALASAFGITDEFHQAFVPLRTPDIRDWLVDTSGAALGALAAAATATRRRRARS